MSKVIINIVGDFCISKLDNLHFGDTLKRRLQDADINVINMEGPVRSDLAVPIYKSGALLCQDPKVPAFLEDNGFNAILLANNHTMDYGEQGLDATKNSFRKALTIGAGTFSEAYRTSVFEIKGRRIGFLSLTQYEFGVLGDIADSIGKTGTAWMLHPVVDELIVKAKATSDFLIVLPHAGLEFFDYPLPEVRTLYKHYIAMGADAVIGNHPHITQGWEFYCGKPILYSLGNFCFNPGLRRNEMWYKGFLSSITIDSRKTDISICDSHYDYACNSVEINDAENLSKIHFPQNDVLEDDRSYMQVVNEKCLSLRNHYRGLFEASGLYQPTIKKLPRVVLNTLRESSWNCVHFNNAHAINSLRCETHRWIISRIFELSKKTQSLI